MAETSPPYRLSYLPRHTDRFADRDERSAWPEARALHRVAYQHIDGLLRTRPGSWGDPIRELRHAELTLRRGLHGGILVEYAVDEERRIVYIRDIRLTSWHPLYRADE